ncbi:hypothetical protein DENIS_3709 [Desulfonema ishimotonii]|uniref:Uncharacterized protein n=1 Tax=Desulfonema ishimotonii TaxID=45657 RepID=A0A401G0H2_9BACT|nr:hypothetical protein DENIS_3709 [Desulfonema ishimotonii]
MPEQGDGTRWAQKDMPTRNSLQFIVPTLCVPSHDAGASVGVARSNAERWNDG